MRKHGSHAKARGREGFRRQAGRLRHGPPLFKWLILSSICTLTPFPRLKALENLVFEAFMSPDPVHLAQRDQSRLLVVTLILGRHSKRAKVHSLDPEGYTCVRTFGNFKQKLAQTRLSIEYKVNLTFADRSIDGNHN